MKPLILDMIVIVAAINTRFPLFPRPRAQAFELESPGPKLGPRVLEKQTPVTHKTPLFVPTARFLELYIKGSLWPHLCPFCTWCDSYCATQSPAETRRRGCSRATELASLGAKKHLRTRRAKTNVPGQSKCRSGAATRIAPS